MSSTHSAVPMEEIEELLVETPEVWGDGHGLDVDSSNASFAHMFGCGSKRMKVETC